MAVPPTNEEGPLTASRLVRWAPLSGIAFVALWLAAFAVALFDEGGESDAEIVAYYADEGNLGRYQTLFFLVVLASLVFLGFLAVLRSRLARAEGRAGPLTTLIFGAGIAASTIWLVAGVFWMGVAYTTSETKEFRIDPDTERLVSEMAYLFWVTGMYAAILVVLGTSLLALRTRVLPRWLGWLGLPIAVSLLGSLGVFPFFLFLGWVLLVSTVLLTRTGEVAARPAREMRTP